MAAYACRAPPTAAPLASHKLQPRALRFPSFRPSRAHARLHPPSRPELRAGATQAATARARPLHTTPPPACATHASTMLVHPIDLPRRANGTTRCRRIHTTWCEGAKASAWRCWANAHQQRQHACAQIHARVPSGLATDRRRRSCICNVRMASMHQARREDAYSRCARDTTCFSGLDQQLHPRDPQHRPCSKPQSCRLRK